MAIGIHSLAGVHHLEPCSMRLFKPSPYRIAFSFIKVVILDDKKELLRSDLCKYLTYCLIGFVLDIEKIVKLSFAAVAAEEEDREEKENHSGEEEVETTVAKRFGAASNDIYLEIFILSAVVNPFMMLNDGVRVTTDFVDV
jgi:hypothetical protein